MKLEDKNHPASRVIDDEPDNFVYTPPKEEVIKVIKSQPKKKTKKTITVARK